MPHRGPSLLFQLMLAEIKESCISGFEELLATAAQASGMENLLTCLIKTEVTEMVNGVVGAIKQGMMQAEKRLRRIALGEGIRVMDKLVTATEALEKLFKQELPDNFYCLVIPWDVSERILPTNRDMWR